MAPTTWPTSRVIKGWLFFATCSKYPNVMKIFPAELLSRIFIHSLPRDLYLEPNEREAPLLLTLVCRRWRAIALTTPQLWSSLTTLPLCYDELLLDGMRSRPIPKYASWLSRSGRCPLSLQHSFETSDPSLDDWTPVLVSHAAQLRRLRAVCCFEMDLGQVLENAHAMQSLTLQGVLSDQGARLTTKQLHHSSAPPYLVIDNIYRPDIFLYSIDCSNLNALALSLPPDVIFNQDDFLRIVDRCPNLERLVCSMITIQTVRFHPRTHSNLKSLAISFHCLFNGASPVLLTLPNLADLRLTSRFRDLEEELGGSEVEFPCGDLRTIWVGGGEQEGLQLLDLGWNALENIEAFVTGDLVGVIRTLLTLSPKLHTLVFNGKTVETDKHLAPFDEPLSHTLSSLEINVPSRLVNVLDSLSLPHLRTLQVRSTRHSDWPSIQSFLQRTGGSLSKVVLKGTRGVVSMRWAEEEFDKLSASMPQLKELVIEKI